MKKQLLFFVTISFIAMQSIAAERANKSNTTADIATPAAESSSVVLFVGVEDSNLSSNYYTLDEMAQGLGLTDGNELNNRINSMLYDVFAQTMSKSKISLVEDTDAIQNSLAGKIQYQSQIGDELSSDLSAIDKQDFGRLLTYKAASYMLIIDQFTIRREGYPYFNNSHILKYSLYDQSGQKVYEGRHQFASLDRATADELTKQIKKAAAKVPSKIAIASSK